MFQYAAGRSLSILHNCPLLLDTSDFDGYLLHNGFELDHVFDISAKIAKKENLESLLGWQYHKKIRRFIKHDKLKIIRKSNYIVEPHFNHWKNLSQISPPYYLDGYWQSELYFNDVIDTIRRDFIFKESLTGKNKELSEKIDETNSVSIHIRRGDYLNNKNKKIHCICSLQYYQASINKILEKINNPTFFIFSDDIEWSRKNLTTDFDTTYISHNIGKTSYNDMNLMSLCKNNIIANSSFSWWGAWLNSNQNKIVIAPKKWFSVKKNTTNLYPSLWIVI